VLAETDPRSNDMIGINHPPTTTQKYLSLWRLPTGELIH
jgi:hypothetical protein